MNIKSFDIKLGVRIARFREINDQERGEILFSFAKFMKEQGAKYDFLVDDAHMMESLGEDDE